MLSRPWMIISAFAFWMTIFFIYFWWPVKEINHLSDGSDEIRMQFVLPISYPVQFKEFNKSKDKSVDICETIHIAVICAGFDASRAVAFMIKSVLFYRRNPIHFHFITDETAHRILNVLFETWNLPDVTVSFYKISLVKALVDWIPNSHYSGVFGLLKLTLPTLLPQSIEKVIVLDSDLTFMSDVADLWLLFRNMTKIQIIGLTENQSNWYNGSLKYGFRPWPAIGRGYNTGVILMHLANLREKGDWNKLWKSVTDRNLALYSQTKLADQDIFNAIITEQPQLLYWLPCVWNVQLSTSSLSEDCYKESKYIIKIIHWNSPRKYKVKLNDVDYFRSVHQTFVTYDGNLLRNKLKQCSGVKFQIQINKSDICYSFRYAGKNVWRTHINFVQNFYYDMNPFDVTLVAQMSMDRIRFLKRLIAMWEGPISVAIYLTDTEASQLMDFLEEWSDVLKLRTNIGYHLVYKQETHYPVNYLRNVAIENALSPYVFLMDIDFVPMQGLYDYLKSSLQLINPGLSKKALIVPAFESQQYRGVPPKTKKALVKRFISKKDNVNKIYGFRAQEWSAGHAATNYSRWINAEIPYEVDWQPDFEPYLVVHKTVPKYDTRFVGFGWNKVSHSLELKAQGYKLVVLPHAFIVHMPHTPSLEIDKFRNSTTYRKCLALLKKEFISDLQKKYNTNSTIVTVS